MAALPPVLSRPEFDKKIERLKQYAQANRSVLVEDHERAIVDIVDCLEAIDHRLNLAEQNHRELLKALQRGIQEEASQPDPATLCPRCHGAGRTPAPANSHFDYLECTQCHGTGKWPKIQRSKLKPGSYVHCSNEEVFEACLKAAKSAGLEVLYVEPFPNTTILCIDGKGQINALKAYSNMEGNTRVSPEEFIAALQ